MKLTTKFIQATIFILVIAFAGPASAQDEVPPNARDADASRQPDNRSNALRQLGLSREQFQQIRGLNAKRTPLMELAQKRFRDANRSLDEAIYADQLNESLVQERLREVQMAQAEDSKIRFMSELAIRRILTPEQLGRFREIRQRFEQARQRMDDRRNDSPRMPADNNNPRKSEQTRPVNNLNKPQTKKP